MDKKILELNEERNYTIKNEILGCNFFDYKEFIQNYNFKECEENTKIYLKRVCEALSSVGHSKGTHYKVKKIRIENMFSHSLGSLSRSIISIECVSENDTLDKKCLVKYDFYSDNITISGTDVNGDEFTIETDNLYYNSI
ncbi:hypothetical protein [Clostridium sp. BJN0001]|uniref:hypothetical protein n=1 Tax=Clostridium sp. BJN0001 TaxID=2930219 RepID=UPI001FD34A00|nr:hypothetical protein [Clostridium sp. BJN0001]